MIYLKLFEEYNNLPEDDILKNEILDILSNNGFIVDNEDVIEYTNSEIIINLGNKSLNLGGEISLKQRNSVLQQIEKLPNIEFVNFDEHLLKIHYI